MVLVVGFISKLFGGKGEENEEIENEILYSQIYKDKSPDYCSEILLKYIFHFMNYDFINNNTFNIIEQLSSEYILNIKQKKYFLEMLNSNMIYLKNSNPYFSSDNKLNIKKPKNQNKEILNKFNLSFIANKLFKFSKNNSKIKIILFSLKYLISFLFYVLTKNLIQK